MRRLVILGAAVVGMGMACGHGTLTVEDLERDPGAAFDPAVDEVAPLPTAADEVGVVATGDPAEGVYALGGYGCTIVVRRSL